MSLGTIDQRQEHELRDVCVSPCTADGTGKGGSNLRGPVWEDLTGHRPEDRTGGDPCSQIFWVHILTWPLVSSHWGNYSIFLWFALLTYKLALIAPYLQGCCKELSGLVNADILNIIASAGKMPDQSHSPLL